MTGGERARGRSLAREVESDGGIHACNGAAGHLDSSPVNSPMRVLAHIHTFNDADVIDATIESLLRQTRPVDHILVVDNASVDGTLDRPSLRHATVLRHSENTGTSGAVHSGFRFALEHDYDWIWVLDADSVPEPDALEKLLAVHAGFPPERREETAFLACLHYDVQDGTPRHGIVFTRRGLAPVEPAAEDRYYPCHVNIWSGCLYRLDAVRRIGLPNPDYVLDWGEGEYGHRIMQAGYKAFVCQEALLAHNVRGAPGIPSVRRRFGPLTLRFYEMPAFRCYYVCRNPIYFALYEFKGRRALLALGYFFSVSLLTLNFLVRPRSHFDQILACWRGLRHGLTGNIAARFPN